MNTANTSTHGTTRETSVTLDHGQWLSGSRALDRNRGGRALRGRLPDLERRHGSRLPRPRDGQRHGGGGVKRLTDLRHAARFEIEARLLASLRHLRVVRVRNYLQDETGQYVVMDLVEGVDLGDLLKREGQPGLPLGDAIEYAPASMRGAPVRTSSRSCTGT